MKIWDDDRNVERLKQLWADGFSASQIAADIGGITGNAVIGKVHRLGIAARPSRAITAARALKSDLKPVPSKRNQPPRPQATLALNVPPPTEATYVAPDDFDSAIPKGQRCSIFELTSETCHWPIGDGPSLFFCGGSPVGGSPYCPHHTARAYTSGTAQRRGA